MKLFGYNTNKNVSDVVNYIKVIEFAIECLNKLSLCNILIREIHKVLMSGVRGSENFENCESSS